MVPDDLLAARDSWQQALAERDSLALERDALRVQFNVSQDTISTLQSTVAADALRVAELTAEIARLQAIIDAEEPPPVKTALGVNAESSARFRASFISANGNSAPPLAVERIFIQSETWGTGKWLDVVAAIKAGRTPIVSIKPTVSWSQVPTAAAEIARYDDAVKGLLALDISKLAVKPRLVWQHEPEKSTLGTAASFNTMQRFLEGRFFDRLAAGGWGQGLIFMNGSFFVRPDGTTYTKWTRADLESAIAGLRTKDVFADLYEKPGGGEPWATADVGDPTSTKSTFYGYVTFCKAKGFNMGATEFGINRKQSDNTGAQPAQFIDALAASPLFDDVEFWIYYDRDVGEGGATGNHRISQFVLPMKSYAKLAA